MSVTKNSMLIDLGASFTCTVVKECKAVLHLQLESTYKEFPLFYTQEIIQIISYVFPVKVP